MSFGTDVCNRHAERKKPSETGVSLMVRHLIFIDSGYGGGKHHRRVPPDKAGAFEECLPLKRANCGKRHMGSLIRSVPFNFR